MPWFKRPLGWQRSRLPICGKLSRVGAKKKFMKALLSICFLQSTTKTQFIAQLQLPKFTPNLDLGH